jgi:pyruvyltransferase
MNVKNLYYWRKKLPFVNIYRDNFGDYLSRVVVEHVLKTEGIKNMRAHNSFSAIGSILHKMEPYSTIWGSGVNGKIELTQEIKKNIKTLDFRAVRGRGTLRVISDLGLDTSGIAMGDPALLLKDLLTGFDFLPISNKISWLPNLNDKNRSYQSGLNYINPLWDWQRVLKEILTSERLITSSLHGLILAETYGVECRCVLPQKSETVFKYNDYLTGTNRQEIEAGSSFFCSDKITYKTGATFSELDFDTTELKNAFPYDLFGE